MLFDLRKLKSLDSLYHGAFTRRPRKRTTPLIPEPFKFCYKADAKEWNVLIPDLNVSKHLETLSKPLKTKLQARAENLAWRARKVSVQSVSEFYWEVGAWLDVFDTINRDDDLLIDKRPYRFVETDNSGNFCVKTRIPDATFGVRAFSDVVRAIGYPLYRKGIKKEPEPLLYHNRLKTLTCNPQCGLIVDGMWGKTNLIFPFAAYEAKGGHQFSAAEKQIRHACQTYLAMLDDLARNPNNVSEYQTKESSQFQFFFFTSVKSCWTVNVAWSSMEDCMVQTIWEGHIDKASDALQLIYIVDQVHDYATEHHLPFVLKHLEAWYAREKQYPMPELSILDMPEKQPPWMILQNESKRLKQEKAQDTRKRKRSPSDIT